MEKVVVIGGGLVGMSAAYRLVRHGVEVVLVDRADKGKAMPPANSPPAKKAIGYFFSWKSLRLRTR